MSILPSTLKRQITEEEFLEIKDLQESEELSTTIAKQFELSLVTINNVFKSESFSQYENTFVKEDGDELNDEDLLPEKSKIVEGTKSGFFRSIVDSKTQENSSLKQQREWLMEQVYFLRKSVKFLEIRKDQLEKGIAGLEKNMNIGISALENLEDNNNFSTDK